MKNLKFVKLCRIALLVVFLGVIFGIMFLTAYKTVFNYQWYSYFENRNLNPFPDITKESVMDGSFFSDFEDWYRDHIAARTAVVKYHTLLNMDALKRPVVNDVVILDDLYLPYNEPEIVNEESIIAQAEQVSDNLQSHVKLAEEIGAKFYYVAVPCQYVFYEDMYPWYLNSRSEYTDASSESLFTALEAKGVPYIDMCARFNDIGNRPEFSSKVDNHYSIFGAYETYKAILERYNADTSADLDILDGDEYSVTEISNNYVGSRTRKLLGLKKSDEKLSIIEPVEEVPFTRWDRGNETPSESAVYSMPTNDYDDVLYSLYMGGDIPITKIDTERPDLPKILVYGDSFTNAVESIIWYNFDTMHSLDFRYYSDMSLENFIRQEQPDLIVCIRDYQAMLAESGNGQ